MSHYLSKSSITSAWLLTLVALLWVVSGTVTAGALVALAVGGLAPLAVLLFLARRPEMTTAEVIRAIDAGNVR